MQELQNRLLALQGIAADHAGQQAIEEAGHCLMNDCSFIAFGFTCRLLEVEFYLYSATHPDPFTHRHEIQSSFGQWYFHRVGRGYKSGSFKGLDLTFGDPGSNIFGGVLIRSIVTHENEIVCGPSLSVDFLLAAAGMKKVQEINEAVGNRKIWDEHNQLRLCSSATPAAQSVYRSTRVGLSTKRISENARPDFYLERPYRCLANPRAIKKGRTNLLSTLSRDGISIDEIQTLTGSPRSAIVKHARASAN